MKSLRDLQFLLERGVVSNSGHYTMEFVGPIDLNSNSHAKAPTAHVKLDIKTQRMIFPTKNLCYIRLYITPRKLKMKGKKIAISSVV